MHWATLLASGRSAPNLYTSCSNRAFRQQAFTARLPRRSVAAYRQQKQQVVRCLIATGGSDSDEDEPTPVSSTSSFSSLSSTDTGFGLNPDLEQPVPSDQRPVNELAALRGTWLYSWVCRATAASVQTDNQLGLTLQHDLIQAKLELPSYLIRLGAVWLGFFALVAGPIAFQTFNPAEQVSCTDVKLCQANVAASHMLRGSMTKSWQSTDSSIAMQPAEWMMSGTLGALAVVAAAVVRIYLGWAYVGNRLLSAAVEYEETGWCELSRFAALLCSLLFASTLSCQCYHMLYCSQHASSLRIKQIGIHLVLDPTCVYYYAGMMGRHLSSHPRYWLETGCWVHMR